MKTAIQTLISLFAFLPAFAQSSKTPTDYLKLAGPIVFEKKAYHLVWTSHPTPDFYKQEYILNGDIITKFKTMILVDAIASDNLKEIVRAKTGELKKMREVNPMVNYEILENSKNNEYILDFLLSQSSDDGKRLTIVERNVYRYKAVTDKSGKKFVILFGVSTRSYGNDIDNFLAALKSTRNKLIQSVSQFVIPQIAIPR